MPRRNSTTKSTRGKKTQGEEKAQGDEKAMVHVRIIENIESNFSGGVDYFDLLVRAFQDLILTEDQDYMKNFYVILPACMLNSAETIRQAKFRMNKIHRGMSAYFADDGFTLGVAFMLAVLKQRADFDSLHWFKTVDLHCQKVKEDTEKVRYLLVNTKTDTFVYIGPITLPQLTHPFNLCVHRSDNLTTINTSF